MLVLVTVVSVIMVEVLMTVMLISASVLVLCWKRDSSNGIRSMSFNSNISFSSNIRFLLVLCATVLRVIVLDVSIK